MPPVSARIEPFRVEVCAERDRVRVVAVGELDLATAIEMEEQLRELPQSGVDHVVLDLCGLSFTDCSGLRVVIMAQASASETGRRLDVVGARDQVKRLDAHRRRSSALGAACHVGARDDTNRGVVTSSLLAFQTRGSGLRRASQP